MARQTCGSGDATVYLLELGVYERSLEGRGMPFTELHIQADTIFVRSSGR